MFVQLYMNNYSFIFTKNSGIWAKGSHLDHALTDIEKKVAHNKEGDNYKYFEILAVATYIQIGRASCRERV